MARKQSLGLEVTFSWFDADGDGRVTYKDLNAVMRSLGQNPSESELQDLINEMDTANSNAIIFSDFVTMMTGLIKDANVEKELTEAFKVFDVNNSGFISATELEHIMASIGEKLTWDEISEIFGDAGHYGNGRISCDDFVQILLRM